MRAPDGQIQQIKMRVGEELRARLEGAALEKGRTLNGEINARLEGSFATEDRFGSRENEAVFRVLGQALHELEQRTGARWTRDYSTWCAARELVMAHIDQLMPNMAGAELIAALRADEVQAEAELRAAATEYNMIYSQIFEDDFQPIRPFDDLIEAGTFDDEILSEPERHKRASYKKMYECNQRLLEIQREMRAIAAPQIDQQRRYAKIAHEVLEAYYRKSEDGKLI